MKNILLVISMNIPKIYRKMYINLFSSICRNLPPTDSSNIYRVMSCNDLEFRR